MGRQKDLLANSELGRVDARVNTLNVADSSADLVSEVEEGVAALDVVSLDQALRASADGDVDELAGEDEVDVGDLLVGGDEGGEGDVVVCGNEGQRVAALDDVRGVDGDSAGGGGLGGGRGDAGLVVRGGAGGGDDEDLAGHDEVGVGDVVVVGDVADAGLVLLGNGGEGVAGDDGVVGSAGGAAGELACWG